VHRRPVGRGRTIAALSAIVLLVGSVLPWYTAGGADGIPAASGNAFEGAGIVVFLAALATLALVTLPYAAGDRPVGFDRWPWFAIVWLAAVVAFSLRVADLAGQGVLGLPDRAPGLWLTAAGLIVLGRAVYEIWAEPDRG
jgi:hypothetical protein